MSIKLFEYIAGGIGLSFFIFCVVWSILPFEKNVIAKKIWKNEMSFSERSKKRLAIITSVCCLGCFLLGIFVSLAMLERCFDLHLKWQTSISRVCIGGFACLFFLVCGAITFYRLCVHKKAAGNCHVLVACLVLYFFLADGCFFMFTVKKSAVGETVVSHSEGDISLDEVPEVPEYDVFDYVTLCDFSKVILQVEKFEVSDEDVESTIQQILEQNANYVAVEKETVEENDCVNVSYAVVTDGEIDESSKVEGAHMDLADTSVSEDPLCSQLVGKAVGSTENYTVAYDENSVVYNLTINSIETKEVPELTDDFVQQVSQESKNVEEYRAEIRASMEESYESAEEQALRNSLQEAALEQCEIKGLPDGLVDARLAEYVNGDKKSAQGAGLSFDEYLSNYYGFDTEEEYRTQLKDYVEETCKCELILEGVREKNNLSLSAEEYEQFCEDAYSNYNFSSKEEFVEYYGEDEVKTAALNELTWKFLEELVQIEYE